MKNLNIYFSDICNLSCKYCCLRNQQHNTNTLICEALQNGSFLQHIRNNLSSETISLGIWGMEPTINGQYFQNLIYQILDYSPYIKYISIASNGISNSLYTNFIIPLINYTTLHKRKIKLWIQISLDGPADIMIKHCNHNIYNQVVQNLKYICTMYPKTYLPYLRLKLTIKPTFQPEDWYINPQIWLNWRNNLYNDLNHLIQNNKNFIDIRSIATVLPTIEHGNTYTKEDGKAYAQWKMPIKMYAQTCAAGIESKTIDYNGILYDCPMLKNKQDINEQTFQSILDNKIDELITKQEISSLNDTKYLKMLITSNYCPVMDNINNIDNYFRLFGNGALYPNLIGKE